MTQNTTSSGVIRFSSIMKGSTVLGGLPHDVSEKPRAPEHTHKHTHVAHSRHTRRREVTAFDRDFQHMSTSRRAVCGRPTENGRSSSPSRVPSGK